MSTSASASCAERRAVREAGTGVISTLIGGLVVLALLLFAVQVVLGLYATSVVTAVAYDAAKSVAGADAVDPETATAAARRSLGRWGERAGFRWAREDDEVVLRVRLPAPTLLPAPFTGLDVDRTVRVRVETVR